MINTLLIVAGAYLVLGIIGSTLPVYFAWREGEDFTISDLALWAVRILVWPAGLWLLIEDRTGKPMGEIVLFRGSKSARVLRALKEDD